MWRLDMGELGRPRRRRRAEPDDEPRAELEPEEFAEAEIVVEPEDAEEDAQSITEPAEILQSDVPAGVASSRPAIHLPLSDPYQAPEGYVIKANTHSGLYYTPDSRALRPHRARSVVRQ